MTVDDVRRRARQELGEVVSMETADYLLDRPPGGWGELATKGDLDRRFADVDRRFTETDRKIGELDKKFEYKLTELDKKFEQKIDDLGELVRMTISSTVDRAITTATWRLVMALFTAIGILGLLVKL